MQPTNAPSESERQSDRRPDLSNYSPSQSSLGPGPSQTYPTAPQHHSLSPTGLGINPSSGLPSGPRPQHAPRSNIPSGDIGIARSMARSLVIGPSSATTRRYQPYLSNINTDRSSWTPPNPATASTSLQSHAGSTFTVDSPISSDSNAYSMSAFSAAPSHGTSAGAAAHSVSYVGAPSTEFQPASYPSEYTAQHIPSHHPQRPYTGASYAPQALTPTLSNTPHINTGILSDAPPYGQQPMSPRRHTFSGPFTLGGGSPGSADSMGVGEEEVVVKEEKRRRNKESSQRFRDRTRERQREKQERLEYLERRVKNLEDQLKDAHHARPLSPPDGPSGSGGAPVARMLIGDNEPAMVALNRLQSENDGLRAALRTAEQELIRSRSPYHGTTMPGSGRRASTHNSPDGLSQAQSAHSSPSGGFTMSAAGLGAGGGGGMTTCSAPVSSHIQQSEFSVVAAAGLASLSGHHHSRTSTNESTLTNPNVMDQQHQHTLPPHLRQPDHQSHQQQQQQQQQHHHHQQQQQGLYGTMSSVGSSTGTNIEDTSWNKSPIMMTNPTQPTDNNNNAGSGGGGGAGGRRSSGNEVWLTSTTSSHLQL